jgi:hypothetical protein
MSLTFCVGGALEREGAGMKKAVSIARELLFVTLSLALVVLRADLAQDDHRECEAGR